MQHMKLLFVILLPTSLFVSGSACPELDQQCRERSQENIEWMAGEISWRNSLAEWKLLVEEKCESVLGENWQSLFECPDFSAIRCVNESARRNETDLFNCAFIFCEDGQYHDPRVLRAFWKQLFKAYKSIMEVYKDKLIHCPRKECQGTATATEEPSTSTDQEISTAEGSRSSSTWPSQESPVTVMPPSWNATDCSVDMIFVLDGSDSVKSENFSLVKQWVNATAQNVTTLYPDIQLGVMQFSHYYSTKPLRDPGQRYIKMEVELGYYNYSDFASAVDKIVFMGFTTHTAAALRSVKYDFAASANFNKTDNFQIMILVTDGQATDGEVLPLSATDLKSIGVVSFVVGVGQKTNETQMRTIATGNVSSSDRVTTVQDFFGLQSTQLDFFDYLESC